jgi:hypothetical protein
MATTNISYTQTGAPAPIVTDPVYEFTMDSSSLSFECTAGSTTTKDVTSTKDGSWITFITSGNTGITVSIPSGDSATKTCTFTKATANTDSTASTGTVLLVQTSGSPHSTNLSWTQAGVQTTPTPVTPAAYVVLLQNGATLPMKDRLDDGYIVSGSTGLAIRGNDICYGAGHYVAVGKKTSGSGGEIAFSSNGITWDTLHVSPEPSCICYTGSKFIAIGASTVFTSTDGETWATTAVPGLLVNQREVHGTGNYVYTAGSGGVTYSSTDAGVTWAERSITITSNSVFVKSGTEILLGSVSGTTQSLNATSYGGANTVKAGIGAVSVLYFKNYYFAIGENGGVYKSSSPSGTWTISTTLSDTNVVRTRAYNGFMFVMGNRFSINSSTSGSFQSYELLTPAVGIAGA